MAGPGQVDGRLDGQVGPNIKKIKKIKNIKNIKNFKQ